MHKLTRLAMFTMTAVVLGLLATACDRRAQTNTASPVAAQTPAVSAAALETVLTMADEADGNRDHVVSKCVTCSLHMDGKPEHGSAVGDYTVELCSDGCKTKFDKDPAKALAALEK